MSIKIASSHVHVQVVGEYAYVKEDMDIEEILEKVTLLLGRRFEESDTHGWVVTAITKLVSQLGHMPESVQNQVALYLTSTNTDIQQVTKKAVIEENYCETVMLGSVLCAEFYCNDCIDVVFLSGGVQIWGIKVGNTPDLLGYLGS